MRFNKILIILIFFSSHFLFAQSDLEDSIQTASEKLFLGAEFTATYPISDFVYPELDYSARLVVEYLLPANNIHEFGIRLIATTGYISAQLEKTADEYPPPLPNFRTFFYTIGCGIVYAINLESLLLYLSGTISLIKYDPRNQAGIDLPNNIEGIYTPNSRMFTPEIGLRFPFEKILTLNLGVSINFTDTDFLDDIKAGNYNDIYYSVIIGFSVCLN